MKTPLTQQHKLIQGVEDLIEVAQSTSRRSGKRRRAQRRSVSPLPNAEQLLRNCQILEFAEDLVREILPSSHIAKAFSLCPVRPSAGDFYLL